MPRSDGIAAMADAGTVGVLLPGAFYTLRETQHPPIDAMRRAGVAMAVASDANPGTSPIVLPTLMLKPEFADRFETGVPHDSLKQLTHVSRLLDEILNRTPNRHQP